MQPRQLAVIAGVSYLVIFLSAIFANFVVLEALLADPVAMVRDQAWQIRFGVMAFLLAAVFDVVVAWALYLLYQKHSLSLLSVYFRLLHATIMGLAVFALLATLTEATRSGILSHVTTFNTMWLIGLFFFGVHLMLLSRIVNHITYIPWLLFAAGVMYIVDTTAQFTLANYAQHADIFLLLVAVPAVAGEMSFTVWLLLRGGK